jgi:hypothetical protein
MGGNNTKNYIEQGGDRTVIGGSIDVVSGGEIDIEAGGALKIAGTAVESSAAELNKLKDAGAAVASGTQAAVIADPTGGATTDAEARTAIAAIIDALQAFGIVATS